MTLTPVTDRLSAIHKQEWTDALEGMIGLVHVINARNGWHDDERSFEADVALLHSEVSEAFEAYRKDNWDGAKDSVQDELADILIRLLDTCERHNVNITKQFLAKCGINENRTHRHGGKIL